MLNFLLALQFLTVLPTKIKRVYAAALAKSLVFFPLAGVFLGVSLAAFNYFFGLCGIPERSADIIIVVMLAVLTGGMHLDGLADTCDALFSRKNREEMLRIMRDSHSGAMGVIAIACALLLKISLLWALSPQQKAPALILACALSRWSMVMAIFVFPYARQEGKALPYFSGINRKIFFTASAIAVASIYLAGGGNSIFIALSAAALTALLGRGISRKLGGITGDSLGAINEINEIFALFLFLCLR